MPTNRNTPEPLLNEFERAQERARFRSRLGTYFLGVAIGCALLGLFWMQRQGRQAAKAPVQAAPAQAAPVQPTR
jgi:Flp pilus assembly protein TadB